MIQSSKRINILLIALENFLGEDKQFHKHRDLVRIQHLSRGGRNNEFALLQQVLDGIQLLFFTNAILTRRSEHVDSTRANTQIVVREFIPLSLVLMKTSGEEDQLRIERGKEDVPCK